VQRSVFPVAIWKPPSGYSFLNSRNPNSIIFALFNAGRLAMVAVFGMWMQGAVTGTGPVANWCVRHSPSIEPNMALERKSRTFAAYGVRCTVP
jgi:hypothetical protein